MRRLSLPRLLGLILVALAAVVTAATVNVHRGSSVAARRGAPADSAQHGADAAQALTDTVQAWRLDSDMADSVRRAETRAIIASRAPGTFMTDILRLSDSTLQRWPDRRAAPLRVFISDQGPKNAGRLRDDFSQAVREAFTTWEEVELPVRFVFVTDSALADVTVSWVTDFNGDPVLGRTKVVRDSHYWIVRSDIQLATMRRDATGELDPTVIRALAIHEIGHGIGLDHAGDTTVIMAPKIRARALTLTDKATAQLLYSVPPGSIVTVKRASMPAMPAMPEP